MAMKKREIVAGCKFGLRYLQPPHNEAPKPKATDVQAAKRS